MLSLSLVPRLPPRALTKTWGETGNEASSVWHVSRESETETYPDGGATPKHNTSQSPSASLGVNI